MPSPETWAGCLQSLLLGGFSYTESEGQCIFPATQTHRLPGTPSPFEGLQRLPIAQSPLFRWTPPPPPLPLAPASFVNCRHPSVAFTHSPLAAPPVKVQGEGVRERTHMRVIFLQDLSPPVSFRRVRGLNVWGRRPVQASALGMKGETEGHPFRPHHVFSAAIIGWGRRDI